jgi:hypothetical protein
LGVVLLAAADLPRLREEGRGEAVTTSAASRGSPSPDLASLRSTSQSKSDVYNFDRSMEARNRVNPISAAGEER